MATETKNSQRRFESSVADLVSQPPPYKVPAPNTDENEFFARPALFATRHPSKEVPPQRGILKLFVNKSTAKGRMVFRSPLLSYDFIIGPSTSSWRQTNYNNCLSRYDRTTETYLFTYFETKTITDFFDNEFERLVEILMNKSTFETTMSMSSAIKPPTTTYMPATTTKTTTSYSAHDEWSKRIDKKIKEMTGRLARATTPPTATAITTATTFTTASPTKSATHTTNTTNKNIIDTKNNFSDDDDESDDSFSDVTVPTINPLSQTKSKELFGPMAMRIAANKLANKEMKTTELKVSEASAPRAVCNMATQTEESNGSSPDFGPLIQALISVLDAISAISGGSSALHATPLTLPSPAPSEASTVPPVESSKSDEQVASLGAKIDSLSAKVSSLQPPLYIPPHRRPGRLSFQRHLPLGRTTAPSRASASNRTIPQLMKLRFEPIRVHQPRSWWRSRGANFRNAIQRQREIWPSSTPFLSSTPTDVGVAWGGMYGGRFRSRGSCLWPPW